MVYSIPTGMKWSIPLWPEVVHIILAGMDRFIPAGIKCSFHGRKKEICSQHIPLFESVLTFLFGLIFWLNFILLNESHICVIDFLKNENNHLIFACHLQVQPFIVFNFKLKKCVLNDSHEYCSKNRIRKCSCHYCEMEVDTEDSFYWFPYYVVYLSKKCIRIQDFFPMNLTGIQYHSFIIHKTFS